LGWFTNAAKHLLFDLDIWMKEDISPAIRMQAAELALNVAKE
jgi:hypothetical protein